MRLTQVVCLQGKFSELDSTSWTPELQRALNYDRKSALQIDNGKILLVLLIDLNCLCDHLSNDKSILVCSNCIKARLLSQLFLDFGVNYLLECCFVVDDDDDDDDDGDNDDDKLFSRVKISSFRSKAHLVFHWW